MQFCEGFMKEWFDRQHTNTSALYREGFGEGRRRHTELNHSDYLRRVFQNILMCAFVSLAACQWRREDNVDRIRGERSLKIVTNTKSPQNTAACTICWASYTCTMGFHNDALSTARLVVHEGRRGELQEGGPCQVALSISFLLAVVCSIMW